MIWEIVKAITQNGVRTGSGFKRAIGNKRFQVGERVLTADGFVIGHEPYRNSQPVIVFPSDNEGIYWGDFCWKDTCDGYNNYLCVKFINPLEDWSITEIISDLKIKDIIGSDEDSNNWHVIHGKEEISFIITDKEYLIHKIIKNGTLSEKKRIYIGCKSIFYGNVYYANGFYDEKDILHACFVIVEEQDVPYSYWSYCSKEMKESTYSCAKITVCTIEGNNYTIKNFSTRSCLNKIFKENGANHLRLRPSLTENSVFNYDMTEGSLIVPVSGTYHIATGEIIGGWFPEDVTKSYYFSYLVKIKENGYEVLYQSKYSGDKIILISQTGDFTIQRQFRGQYDVDFILSDASLGCKATKFKDYFLKTSVFPENSIKDVIDIFYFKENYYLYRDDGNIVRINDDQRCFVQASFGERLNIGVSTIKNIKRITGGKINEN